jgi:hypothetical protein
VTAVLSIGEEIRRTPLVTIARAAWRGQHVVVVQGRAGVPPAEVAGRLSALHDAHRGVRHPRVAPAVHAELATERPFVVFDCPAVCDASLLISRLSERMVRIPYAAADAHIVSLREALRAAHRAEPPAFIGRMSPHNVLYSADGNWWLLGLGANVVIDHGGGRYDPDAQVFQAPELIGDAQPTDVTDFLALLLFMRSVLAYVELPASLARLLRGELEADDAPLAASLLEFEQRVVSALPGQRASIDEAIAVSDRIRSILRSGLDEERYRQLAARLLTGLGAASVVAMTADGSEVVTAEGRHTLGRAPRRLLLALQGASLAGEALDVDACIEVGWPGQKMLFDAGRNRVYAAIRALRRAGVRVERFDGGYRLAAPLQLA